MNKVLVALASATLAACSQSPNNVQTQPPTSSTPSKVNLPSVNNPMAQQLSGTITLTNNSGPGTATFTAAPVFNQDADPTVAPSFGSGAFSVLISGTTYASTTAQSAYTTEPDESGNSYLLLNLFAQDSGNNGQELTVITPASSFVAGGTVALDGVNSVAVFGAGDVTQPQPSFYAVATTGTVTFAATASLTGTIDATLTATFTQAQIDSPDGGDPTRSPDGGTTPPPTSAPIPDGTYAFVDDAATQVQCYGALVGKEGDFSSLAPATWAFSGSSITVTNTNGIPTVSAPGLATIFGQTSLTLSGGDPGGPPWEFDVTPQPIAGAPDGTTLIDAAFVLESDPGNTVDGGVALAFALDDAQRSYCSVYFSYGVATP
jgi:hypothetical protein